MRIRLDLRTRHLNRTGCGTPTGLDIVLLRPDCFGCADCGRWFQFARELVAHVAGGCDGR